MAADGSRLQDPTLSAAEGPPAPVALASRAMTGHVFTRTYGYPGSEIDLTQREVPPSGYLSGLKARLLLGFVLRNAKSAAKVYEAFGPYH